MWRVLLISAGLHVLVIAALWPTESESPIVSPPAPPPVAKGDEVIEVTWVNTDRIAPLEARVPIAAVARRSDATQIATASHARTVSHDEVAMATPSTPTEHVDGDGHSDGHGLPAMHLPDLRPSDAALEHIAAAPGHGPRPVAHSGLIEDAVDGSARIDDTVTTVEIERDGTAHFHDKGDAAAHVTLTKATMQRAAHEAAEYVSAWAEATDPKTANNHEHDVTATCDERSAFMCNIDHPNQNAKGMSLLGGKLDLTSYLMRKVGIDPNSSRKLKLLDDTRAERAERGEQYRSQQYAKSAELMQANLRRSWASTQSADERRAVLFALWDECDEGDGEAGQAGEHARAMVIGWIHAHTTYTSEQLEALNARRTSHQPFAP
jgi:hypothetical protein